MLWYIALCLHAAFLAYLFNRPDGRPRFEAFLVARFIFDVAQLTAERLGNLRGATNFWYLGILVSVPLLYLALQEASTALTAHRSILYAWVSLTMAAAWIRFFPYTGNAVLIIDGVCYLAWIVDKFRLSSNKNYS